MNFITSSMEVEDAISIYANQYGKNEKVKGFFTNVSFLANLIKRGVDVNTLIGNNDEYLFNKCRHLDLIKKLANIMGKDMRFAMIHNSPVLKQLQELNVENMTGGADTTGAPVAAAAPVAAGSGSEEVDKDKAQAELERLLDEFKEKFKSEEKIDQELKKAGLMTIPEYEDRIEAATRNEEEDRIMAEYVQQLNNFLNPSPSSSSSYSSAAATAATTTSLNPLAPPAAATAATTTSLNPLAPPAAATKRDSSAPATKRDSSAPPAAAFELEKDLFIYLEALRSLLEESQRVKNDVLDRSAESAENKIKAQEGLLIEWKKKVLELNKIVKIIDDKLVDPKSGVTMGMVKEILKAFGIEISESVVTKDKVDEELEELIILIMGKFESSKNIGDLVRIIKEAKNDLYSGGSSKYENLFNYEKVYEPVDFYKQGEDGKYEDVVKKEEKQLNGKLCDKDDENCVRLMTQCLAGKNINKCKAFMEKEKFYPKAADAVKHMDIDTVTTFLNAYKVGINNRTGEIETPAQYMWRLHNYAVENNDKNFNYKDWVAINNNTKLKTFIGYLVDKYKQHKKYFSKPEKGNYGVSRVTRITDSSPHFSPYLRYEVKRKLDNYAINLGLGNVSTFGSPYVLIGGSNNKGKYLSNLIKNGGSADLPFETVHMYEQSLKNSKEILKQNNSALDSADEEYFNKLIDETKNTLGKIKEIHDIASMYASLLINHTINDGEKVSEIVDMEKLIQKHSKSINKLSSLNLKGSNIVATIEKATSSPTFNGTNFE